jgi:hypothetical protein
MKLLIFVYTCAAYEKTRALLIENSWAKDNLDIVFVTDNPKSQLKNSLYLGEYTTSYLKDPLIVGQIFNRCLTEPRFIDYDWYMITDDDSYLFIDKLKEFLTFFDENNSYMIGNYYWKLRSPAWNSHEYKWSSGGCGHVFTKSAILKLSSIIQTNTVRLQNEDVWLNELTKRNFTIQRVHCPGFYQWPEHPEYANDDKRLISIHLNHDMSLIEKYHMV